MASASLKSEPALQASRASSVAVPGGRDGRCRGVRGWGCGEGDEEQGESDGSFHGRSFNVSRDSRWRGEQIPATGHIRRDGSVEPDQRHVGIERHVAEIS